MALLNVEVQLRVELNLLKTVQPKTLSGTSAPPCRYIPYLSLRYRNVKQTSRKDIPQ